MLALLAFYQKKSACQFLHSWWWTLLLWSFLRFEYFDYCFKVSFFANLSCRFEMVPQMCCDGCLCGGVLPVESFFKSIIHMYIHNATLSMNKSQ